jgi:hypothetical protein
MLMKLTALNEETGEFGAINVSAKMELDPAGISNFSPMDGASVIAERRGRC